MAIDQQGLSAASSFRARNSEDCYPVIIVTGLSGAGKSTALNVFEDLGFFCVDGLPLSLTPAIMQLFARENPIDYRGLALGMDLRQSDFAREWSGVVSSLRQKNIQAQIIFLEAGMNVLVRRYATTRRPHPLESKGLGLEQAMDMEKQILEPVRSMAHLVVDTSDFSIHDLRRVIKEKWDFLDQTIAGIRLHLISFGFKYGMPSEADMVIDLRFLPNPYFEDELRHLSGKEEIISNYVLKTDHGRSFMSRSREYLGFLIPLFQKEGRYRLTIAFGCTGGRHRSVAVVEDIAGFFRKKGHLISIEHRHLQLG